MRVQGIGRRRAPAGAAHGQVRPVQSPPLPGRGVTGKAEHLLQTPPPRPPAPVPGNILRLLSLGQGHRQPVDGPHEFLHQQVLLDQMVPVILVQVFKRLHPLPEIYHLLQMRLGWVIR